MKRISIVLAGTMVLNLAPAHAQNQSARGWLSEETVIKTGMATVGAGLVIFDTGMSIRDVRALAARRGLQATVQAYDNFRNHYVDTSERIKELKTQIENYRSFVQEHGDGLRGEAGRSRLHQTSVAQMERELASLEANKSTLLKTFLADEHGKARANELLNLIDFDKTLPVGEYVDKRLAEHRRQTARKIRGAARIAVLGAGVAGLGVVIMVFNEKISREINEHGPRVILEFSEANMNSLKEAFDVAFMISEGAS